MLSFFGSAGIARAMQVTSNVPPVYYFLYLLAAGIGGSKQNSIVLRTTTVDRSRCHASETLEVKFVSDEREGVREATAISASLGPCNKLG